MDLSFMQATLLTLIGGLPLTLNLTASSILLGGAGALVLALMRTSGIALLSLPARAYVFVFRGTPLLIQLFMIYYGLGQFRPVLQELGLWSVFRDPYWCAVLAMAMNTAAYSSEIIRGGLGSAGRAGGGIRLRHATADALAADRPAAGDPSGAARLWQ